jgi:hypothetical protein
MTALCAPEHLHAVRLERPRQAADKADPHLRVVLEARVAAADRVDEGGEVLGQRNRVRLLEEDVRLRVLRSQHRLREALAERAGLYEADRPAGIGRSFGRLGDRRLADRLRDVDRVELLLAVRRAREPA